MFSLAALRLFLVHRVRSPSNRNFERERHRNLVRANRMMELTPSAQPPGAGTPERSAAIEASAEYDYTRYYCSDTSDEHFARMSGGAYAWIDPYLPVDRQTPVLDIGCGMGFLLGHYARLGFSSVHGIDADVGQVARCLRRALPVTHVPVELTLQWMDARCSTFGFISVIDVLEHIPVTQQLRFLHGVRQMLRPGGSLLCRVPNANSGLAARWRYNDWTHTCSFTEASLDFVLFNAGFENIRVTEAQPFRLQWSRLLNPRQYLTAAFRLLRRAEFIAEFGYGPGRRIPLTLNVLATAMRPL